MQFGEILGSALLVLLCLTGLTALLQALNRWLLSPGKEHEMVMLVPVRGAQPDAEQLLRGDLSVTEVADMSGFGSLSDLYRHFQKKHGVSPTEFRRMMKKGTK